METDLNHARQTFQQQAVCPDKYGSPRLSLLANYYSIHETPPDLSVLSVSICGDQRI